MLIPVVIYFRAAGKFPINIGNLLMTGMSTCSIIVDRIKKFVDISAVNVFLSIVVNLCWLHWIFPEHPAEVIVRCSASLRGC